MIKKHTRRGIWSAVALSWLGATVSWAGIDKAAVGNIEVIVDAEHLDQFDSAVPTADVSRRIAANLADADFPVRKAGVKAFTHTLTAHYSRVTHQSTPAGFSFSIGNSNPRAQEFQKADVLTVKCELQDRKTTKTESETMEFSAGSLTEMHGNALANVLAEHASSACYNLLENLHLEQTTVSTEGPGKRPRWMPNIRIEVKNVASPTGDNAGTSQPSAQDEPKKELIIHNQGTPVIFKLGHERR